MQRAAFTFHSKSIPSIQVLLPNVLLHCTNVLLHFLDIDCGNFTSDFGLKIWN